MKQSSTHTKLGLRLFKGTCRRLQALRHFSSAVDALADKKLNAIGTKEVLELKGKAANAQAALAFKLYQEKFSGPRWEALAKRGAICSFLQEYNASLGSIVCVIGRFSTGEQEYSLEVLNTFNFDKHRPFHINALQK